jgi:hypothetical protein
MVKVPTPRNDFLTQVFQKIITNFSTDTSVYGIKLSGLSAMLLYRSYFNKNEGECNKYVEYEENQNVKNEILDIFLENEMLSDFLNHIEKFGYIKINQVNSENLSVSIKILYLPDELFFNRDDCPYLNFFIKKYYDLYGDSYLNFKIYMIKNGFIKPTHEHLTLKNNFMCEYISTLDIYCFYLENDYDKESTIPKSDTSLLTLNKVIMTQDYLKLNNNLCYEKLKDKVQITDNVENIFSLLCNYDDIKCFTPLQPNLTQTGFEEEICTICMDKFTSEDQVYKTHCNHFFHFNCISTFLENYYQSLLHFLYFNKNYVVEYDIEGNVINGATYNYCCPNCKKESFHIRYKKVGKKIVITNENCIYKL